MAAKRYLEDLVIAEITPTASVRVEQADTIEFAERYDPQAMHTDPEAASSGPFGGLIASGWHTAAIVMRLMVDARPLGDTPLLGLGVDDLRWPNPVRPGDTVTAAIEILSIAPSKSTRDFGIVRLQVTARNQKDEIVFTMIPSLWVPCRPA